MAFANGLADFVQMLVGVLVFLGRASLNGEGGLGWRNYASFAKFNQVHVSFDVVRVSLEVP